MKAADFGDALAKAVSAETAQDRLTAVLTLLNQARVFGTLTMANAVFREANTALERLSARD